MEIQRMLGTAEAVVVGTEGGPGPDDPALSVAGKHRGTSN